MSAVRRILVAVADSPSGLAAARTAVQLAAATGADLRAVHALVDGELVAALGAEAGPADVTRRRQTEAASVLRHVAHLAQRSGIDVTTTDCVGDVPHCVLEQARRWGADVIVVGRTTRRGAGDPFVGPEVQQILEFSEWPVLVVPA